MQGADPDDGATLVLRPLTLDDFEDVVRLQLACFPKMQPWTRAQFRNQVQRFPEGQIGIEVEGRIVASSSSLVVDYAEYTDWHDWRQIADDGFIRNHDPEGDTLYGIEMQVDPAWRGMRLSRRMYDARKALCRELNLERMVIGGRIPGYGRQADELSPEAYVEAVVERRLHDPVLTTQLSNGFEVNEVVRDYLPTDEDSVGHGTILEWINTDYVPVRSRRQRRAVYPVRVALVQYGMRRVESFEEFARQVEYYVDTASDYRADFLVFPELMSTQLLSVVPPGDMPSQARALAGFTDRYRETFRGLAVRYNVNIIGGSTFTLDADDTLHNTAFLFHRDGRIDEQRKLHITPAEHRWWGVHGGDVLRAFDTDRGRVGILVCYDVEFPELSRVLAASGVSLLFVPFNTADRQGYQRVRLCAHARCIENHLYAVLAGCTGHLPQVANADLHWAQSVVLTPCDVGFPPEGVAAKTAPAIEELIVQDLDLEQLRRHRSLGTVRNWVERRTDLYEVRWKDEPVG